MSAHEPHSAPGAGRRGPSAEPGEGADASPPLDPAVQAAFLDVAHGDRGLAKHFRDSLELLRDKTTDPGFLAVIDDVLAGRKPPRALARSAAFDRVVAPRLEQYTLYLATLTPEERDALAEQGRAQLAELAAEEGELRRD